MINLLELEQAILKARKLGARDHTVVGVMFPDGHGTASETDLFPTFEPAEKGWLWLNVAGVALSPNDVIL